MITQRSHRLDGIFARTPLDTSVIAQDVLDIRFKTRSNPLLWKGQFSPQLVDALLAYYEEPGRTKTVLDPFVGSGTVLLESARRGWHATGVDVNPAAYYLASFYRLAMLPPKQRSQALFTATMLLKEILGSPGPLFDSKLDVSCDVGESLVSVWSRTGKTTTKPGVMEFLSALLVLVDLYRRPVTRERVAKVHSQLVRLAGELPTVSPMSVATVLGDSRAIPVDAGDVDLVLTSPPYINVYNYHQKYRASVEAMGWNVLEAARSEIGSNRKHRGNRVLTVIQYCLDMTNVLREVARILAPGGTAVFVMGRESMVRKTAFFNGEIIAELASGVGMSLRLRQERVFRNRFGQSIYEDILHFSSVERPAAASVGGYVHARSVASSVLRDAVLSCPKESRMDIRAALDRIDLVQPSPLATPTNSTRETTSLDSPFP